LILKKSLLDITKFLLFFSVGIFFIWLSVRNLSQADIDSIMNSFVTANYFWVVPCVFVGIFSHMLRARRWIILMEPMGYNPSLKNTFFAVMIGYFVNMALPRFGEVTRCGILNKYEKIPFNKSFGTVITERVFDMIIFIILFIVILLTQYDRFGSYLETNFFAPLKNKLPDLDAAFHAFLWSTMLIVMLALLLMWVYRHTLLQNQFIARIWRVLRGFLSGVRSLTRIKRPMEFIILTIGIWIMYFLMVYLCFFSIPETNMLGPSAGFSVLVLGSFGIIITPGGIGLYPVIVAETLKAYHIGYTYGLALGWISWAAQSFMIIATGSISFVLLAFSKKKNGLSSTN
jgi:uncharacterized protein (TIRG00374 family)